MPLIVVTPPTDPVLSLRIAKAHLRLDADDGSQDVALDGMIRAAVAHLDGPAGWLNRALGLQTLEWISADFGDDGGGCLVLPIKPVNTVVSVAYVDAAGSPQTLDVSRYRLIESVLLPAFGQCWPATAREPGSVRVRLTAGYTAGSVPAPILAALKLMIATLFEGRETSAAAAFEGAAASLLGPYRVFA